MTKIFWVCAAALTFGSCGVEDAVSTAQSQLQSEFEGYDLSCDFDDLIAASEAESSVALVAEEEASASTCEDSAEQFSLLLASYDTDGDGALSDDEIAEAGSEFSDAQIEAMDSNNDKAVSDTERATWKSTKGPEHKAKRSQKFKQACNTLGKSEAECKAIRANHKEKLKDQLNERKEAFDADKDGKLSEAERSNMRKTLEDERKERREGFKNGIDKDGDGKVGPAERQDRIEKRQQTRKK